MPLDFSSNAEQHNLFNFIRQIMNFSVSVTFFIWVVARVYDTEAKLMIKVVCPEDEYLRKAATTTLPGEDFIIECSNMIEPEKRAGGN